ncbi:hypothetical protein [uncultured Desulfobacter sp.]|uniref:hypothetical protein n=1 Tax=uncultured Desulfobacter sp. TaxID=240139 RepID=UPI002AA9195A|nr:hypothetical protein [uncultured Desulfobacter sp.]
MPIREKSQNAFKFQAFKKHLHINDSNRSAKFAGFCVTLLPPPAKGMTPTSPLALEQDFLVIYCYFKLSITLVSEQKSGNFIEYKAG